MKIVSESLLRKILVLLLRPAVRFCLRHSLRLQDIIECSKAALIEVSRDELQKKNKKPNVSRLSAMSGVHRRDVQRLLEERVSSSYERDLISKVIGRWQNDSDYITIKKEPRVLEFKGLDSEFSRLVHSVSKDLNPGTVLFELERVGAIQESPRGIKLCVQSYVPKGDPIAGFGIGAEDGEDLVTSIEENVLYDQPLPHFHARTSYDNVRPASIEHLKRWFLKEGHEFHAKVRDEVSKYDQDINPDPKFKGKGVKVVFSGFSNIKEEEK